MASRKLTVEENTRYIPTIYNIVSEQAKNTNGEVNIS